MNVKDIKKELFERMNYWAVEMETYKSINSSYADLCHSKGCEIESILNWVSEHERRRD